MTRSAKGGRPARPAAKAPRAPDPKAEIRRFITHLDRLAGPFAPAARGAAGPSRNDDR